MTPEERARADAINDTLTASIQKRKSPPPPPRGEDVLLEPKGKGLIYYGGIVILVAALHLAGWFAYSHWDRQQTAEKESARLADMERRRVREGDAHAEFMRQQLERDAQRARIQQTGSAARVTVAVPKRVEYNVMPTPPPQRADPRLAQQVANQAPQTQRAIVASPAYSHDDHADIILRQARAYFNSDDYAKNLGVMRVFVERIGTQSTFHDTFWNKYVTVGEVTVRYTVRSPGSSYTRTMDFEGETKVEDGRIKIVSDVRSK